MNEPIRVLNVVGEMSPGGIESLIMNIYRNINREKVQFDFLMHSPSGEGSYVPEIERLGGRIYRTPVLKTPSKTYYWRLFQYVSFLKKFFKEHPEFHVVHGHMTNTAAIYMPIAKKYGNVTCCIAHSHLTEARPGLSGKITDLLHKPLPKIATDYFACSEMAAHWIFDDKAINDGKVRIIKNGVDPKKFYYDEDKRIKIRKELSLENSFVIGNVARFKKEKNQSFAVDILKKYIELDDSAKLLFVGDGELRAEVQNKVRDLGLVDKVVFLGIRDDVPDLMLAMDLFLLPSFYEGLPVVGVEAQASGLPVITSTGVTKETDITGNVNFLDLSIGADIWAKKILEIKANFKRQDMYKYISENGYDITDTAKWLQHFYISKY